MCLHMCFCVLIVQGPSLCPWALLNHMVPCLDTGCLVPNACKLWNQKFLLRVFIAGTIPKQAWIIWNYILSYFFIHRNWRTPLNQYSLTFPVLPNIGLWDAYVPQYIFLKPNRIFTWQIHFLECYNVHISIRISRRHMLDGFIDYNLDNN